MEREFLIDDRTTQAQIKLHETGRRMLVFSKFRPQLPTIEGTGALVKLVQSKVSPDIDIIRICLESDQFQERESLEKLGFVADGFEYAVDVTALKARLPRNRATLPPDLSIRRMRYDHDIDAVAALEKRVHAADKSSRVNFETEEAITGMKGYYKNASENYGVYLLEQNNQIVGLIGFMPDKKRDGAVHISSVAVDLSLQGKGLLFPLLLESLKITPFRDIALLTGVTTTTRLVEAAMKYGVQQIGLSLVKFGWLTT